MPKVTYLICCNQRTGSTLMCEALGDTQRAGVPLQYFDVNPAYEERWRQTFKITNDAAYVDSVVAGATGNNGIAGIRLHWDHCDLLVRRLALAEGLASSPGVNAIPNLMRRRYGDCRYIWMRRLNRVAQAISYYRASETNIFWDRIDQQRPAAPPVEFDAEQIDKFLEHLANDNREWANFFMRAGVQPLILPYEHFVSAYEATVSRVLTFIGASTGGLTLKPPRMRRQADEESLEWEARYRALRVRQLGVSALGGTAGPVTQP